MHRSYRLPPELDLWRMGKLAAPCSNPKVSAQNHSVAKCLHFCAGVALFASRAEAPTTRAVECFRLTREAGSFLHEERHIQRAYCAEKEPVDVLSRVLVNSSPTIAPGKITPRQRSGRRGGRRYRSILMFWSSTNGARSKSRRSLRTGGASTSCRSCRYTRPSADALLELRGHEREPRIDLGDWAWSVRAIPRPRRRHFLANWSKPCGMIGGCCRINLRTNFPGEVVNVGAASPTNAWDTKTYNVYRDDYTPHGHAVCASLQRLGGPPCPTRAEGVRIACDHVREAFRQYAPHKKKRCVPMTGKADGAVVRHPERCGR